jgi:hypothetical protein
VVRYVLGAVAEARNGDEEGEEEGEEEEEEEEQEAWERAGVATVQVRCRAELKHAAALAKADTGV